VTDEARVESVESGFVPASEGWFVVNVREAAWVTREGFGARCGFEAQFRLVEGRDDLEQRLFPQLGINLAVLEPGQPSTLYHAESQQEGFLVLAGECLLVVEGNERRLTTWDFFHCPPGTRHAFVGGGEGPCVLLMTGARQPEGTIVYPVEPLAQAWKAGVDVETDSPRDAYAPFPHWRPGRPACWDALPWS
jgi:uncharacterized cupin superfamily protein